MGKQVEKHQYVEQGLVVGNHNISFFWIDVFPALDSDPPGRDNPGIQRSPEAGKLLQNHESPVKSDRDQPDQKRGQEKNYRCHTDKRKPGNCNKAVFHLRPNLL